MGSRFTGWLGGSSNIAQVGCSVELMHASVVNCWLPRVSCMTLSGVWVKAVMALSASCGLPSSGYYLAIVPLGQQGS